MKTGKPRDWYQIIGMAGVIGSLVFVGLQLKQSQDIAIAAQYQAPLEAASGHFEAMLECEPALRVIGADILADIEADDSVPVAIKAWAASQPVEELAYRAIGATIFLKSHDNVYFQYQAGFLSDEAWDALRTQLQAGLEDPRLWVRAVFENNPAIWRESYQELIRGMLDAQTPATR